MSPVPPDESDFTVEACYSLPPGCTPDAITADGHGITFLDLDDGRLQAFWDGEGGEPFEALMAKRDKTATIFISDDGAHVAFIGERAGRFFVGRDGREDPPFEMFTNSVPPVFSQDGVHLAYGAGSIDDHRLILDGQVANSQLLAPNQAVFSPSGERLAFVEMRPTADGWADQRIVLDQSPGEWFRGIRNAQGAMQFSPDSQRFAFYRGDQKGLAQWVVDGQAQRLTNESRSIGLSQVLSEARLRNRKIGVVEPPLMAGFSPDSRRFAYAADVLEKGVAIHEDDVAGPLFKGVGTPVFSPDSRHLAYIAKTFSKKLTLVVDGVAGPEWAGSWSSDPVFSLDSRHVAVTFEREEGNFLRRRHTFGCAVDGHGLAEVEGDEVSDRPVFSPDGEHVAWVVFRGDRNEVMIDGAPHDVDDIANSAPIFTHAGRLVYSAIVPDGRVTMLVDGRRGPLADDLLIPRSAIVVFQALPTGDLIVPFAVSPDGEHLAWAGVFGEESRPVLDDRVGPPFDMILDWSFDPSGTAIWWVQRADTVYRVTAPAKRSRHDPILRRVPDRLVDIVRRDPHHHPAPGDPLSHRHQTDHRRAHGRHRQALDPIGSIRGYWGWRYHVLSNQPDTVSDTVVHCSPKGYPAPAAFDRRYDAERILPACRSPSTELG